jgi:Trypsin-like peptidase domain/Colicin V production protein
VSVTDILLIAWVAIFAVQGAYRGLVAQALSLVGFGIGALAGSWVAPQLLSDNSPWVAFASLAGAVVGALLLGAASTSIAESPRRFLAFRPGLRTVDGIGGALLGGGLGLALAWLIAVVAVHQPALGLRKDVRESTILPKLMRAVPPDRVLQALNRFDPFPQLAVGGAPLPPPDPSILQRPGTKAAAGSVVKIHGTACGLGTQGSGWVVRRALVATNAHVIAGERDTTVLAPNGQSLSAEPVYVDAQNDVALLRVPALELAPLAVDRGGDFPLKVVILGYPRDGPLTGTAATAGSPRSVIAPDAYDRRVGARVIVPLRGKVQPGESGGPVVDARGSVIAMVFAGAKKGPSGYSVPVDLVLRGVRSAAQRDSSGPCVG